MIGTAQIVEAAKEELGNAILRTPLRISCPQCGKFLAAMMSVPVLMSIYCVRCKISVTVLASKKREVLVATER